MLDTLHCHHEKTGGAEDTNAHKLQIEMDELQWKALSAAPGPNAALQRSPGELPSELLNGLRNQIAEATAELFRAAANWQEQQNTSPILK